MEGWPGSGHHQRLDHRHHPRRRHPPSPRQPGRRLSDRRAPHGWFTHDEYQRPGPGSRPRTRVMRSRPMTMTEPVPTTLAADELELIDAYWRAADVPLAVPVYTLAEPLVGVVVLVLHR